jgi:Flp pilus assembly protein TadG
MSRLAKWLKSIIRQQSGQSLAELAISLPILLLLVSVLFDGGRATQGYIAIMNASREGAIAGATTQLADAEITAVVRAELTRSGLDGGLAVVTVTYAGSSPSQTINVEVNYDMPVFTALSPVATIPLSTDAEILVFR